MRIHTAIARIPYKKQLSCTTVVCLTALHENIRLAINQLPNKLERTVVNDTRAAGRAIRMKYRRLSQGLKLRFGNSHWLIVISVFNRTQRFLL